LCARAAGLPNHHRDPFDRFIIAAALDRNLPVVTVDRQFAAYGVTVVA
jgi:PIN domain nuclease of toxin-antitoxin system